MFNLQIGQGLGTVASRQLAFGLGGTAAAVVELGEALYVFCRRAVKTSFSRVVTTVFTGAKVA